MIVRKSYNGKEDEDFIREQTQSFQNDIAVSEYYLAVFQNALI